MSRFTGILFLVASAAAFSLSGTLGSGLMSSGWSPAAAAGARMLVGSVLLLPLALRSLIAAGADLRRAAPSVLAYGLGAIAGAQYAYFQAVRYLPVAVALLVEFAAPVAVLAWWWARGHRPAGVTLLGAALAAAGLVVVLDLSPGASVDVRGVAWALAAMVGLAAYFILSADDSHGLSPTAFASLGLAVGGGALVLLGLVGLLDLSWSGRPPVYGGTAVPTWVAVGVLGVVAGGLAFLFGIEGARRVGSRPAAFVGLIEVVFVALVAWVLLGQTPAPRFGIGAALVLAGISLVQLGERSAPAAVDTALAAPAESESRSQGPGMSQ